MTDQNQDLRDLIDLHTVPTKPRLAEAASTSDRLAVEDKIQRS